MSRVLRRDHLFAALLLIGLIVWVVWLFRPAYAVGNDLPVTVGGRHVQHPPTRGGSHSPSSPPLSDVPAPTFYGEEIRAGSIVYVVDRSGSMWEWDRAEDAKRELITSITALNSSIRFNILVFDCTVANFADKPLRASAESKSAAVKWINTNFRMGGGTGSAPGVVSALAQVPDAVILLTDGAPNCPQDDHRRLIRAANTGIPIHVFGIHATGSYRAWCQGVAADSGGTFYEVS